MPLRSRLLRAWAPLAALVGAVAVAAVVGASGARRLDAASDAQLDSAAAVVAYHVESLLTARLRALENVAAFDLRADPSDADRPAVRGATIASLARRYPEFAWVGFADAAGRVVAARDGLLLGADVSGRDWWQAGRRGPYFGDVREATRLAPLLPAERVGEPRRVLDLAVPLRRDGGEVRGVLAAHVDARWLIAVRDELSRTIGASHGATVRLLQPDGRTIARERVELASEPARGRTTGTLDGRPMALAVRPVAGDVVVERLRWQAVVMRDPVEHRAAGRRFLLQSLATGLAIGLLAAGGVALLARRGAWRAAEGTPA